MVFHQSVEKTISDLMNHMLKRTDNLNTEAQLAIGQEYRERITCILNKDLVQQKILFINTSTFDKTTKSENPFLHI